VNTGPQGKQGFGFENPNKGDNQEWLTPPNIIKALGTFDLDPCSPINRPWDTALWHYTIENDGLTQSWHGRVFMNPPYGHPIEVPWLKKFREHGNGICLIYARTEKKSFQDICKGADGFLFLAGRLRFYHVDGTQGESATASSVLIAYGQHNYEALRNSGLKGALFGKCEMI